MAQENIVVSAKEFDLVKKTLEGFPGQARKAVRLAIIDTAKRGEKFIIKQITTHYDITRESLLTTSHKQKVTFQKVYPGETAVGIWEGTDADLRGGVVCRSPKLPVMRFNVTPRTVPNQKGVPVNRRQLIAFSTVKGQVTVGAPNVFLAKFGYHTGLYKRMNGSASFPAEELMMDPIPQLVAGKRLEPQIARYFRETFWKRVNNHVRQFLGGKDYGDINWSTSA